MVVARYYSVFLWTGIMVAILKQFGTLQRLIDMPQKTRRIGQNYFSEEVAEIISRPAVFLTFYFGKK